MDESSAIRIRMSLDIAIYESSALALTRLESMHRAKGFQRLVVQVHGFQIRGDQQIRLLSLDLVQTLKRNHLLNILPC